MNIISFFSLFLMIGGITVTILTRKQQRKLIGWSVIVCTLFQFFSFALFSGIMEKRISLGFILLGMIVGAVCGAFIKFKKSEKHIYYCQGTVFTVIYLSLLCLNQIFALFNAFIPFLILLSAVSVGLYVGMNIILLVRGLKLSRISAVISVVFILTSFFSLSFSFFAQNDGYDYDAALSAYAKSFEDMYNEVYENIQTDVGLKTKSIHRLEWIKYPYIEDGKVWLSLQIWSEEYYDTDTVWYDSEKGEYVDYPAGVPLIYVSGSFYADVPGWTITVDELKERFPEFLTGTEPTYTEADYDEYMVNSGNEGSQTDSTVTEAGQDWQDGFFYIQFVEYDTAGKAIVLSGIFSSIGAFLGVLMGLPKGVTPAVNYGNAGNDISRPPYELDGKTGADSQNGAPHPGIRRNDGKIYTKNSGWTNEFSIEQQIKSNNDSLDYFKKKIEQYRAEDDKNNLAAAEDTMKDIERKNKYLYEDMSAIKTARIKDDMSLSDDSATRQTINAYYFDAGYDTSKGISFASDIGLAIGTAGVSSAYGSAKTVMTVITAAKDITDTATDAYEALKNKKNVVQFISEQTAKRIVGKAIGTEFDKGKLLYGIDNSKYKCLKALVASGETSANYYVNELADKGNVYENFGKGINNMTGGER